jgi:hypothetical protein
VDQVCAVERGRGGDVVTEAVENAIRLSWAIGAHADLEDAIDRQVLVESDRSEIGALARRQADADQGAGTASFSEKGSLWKKRRGLAKYFWSDLDG